MSVDLFLYVAFLGGLAAGRLSSWRSPWLVRALWADIFLLVFLLGVSLGPVIGPAEVAIVGLSTGFSGLILGSSLVLAFILSIQRVRAPPATTVPPFRWTGLSVLAALTVGIVIGRVHPFPSGTALSYSLYALMALVAFDLKWAVPKWRRVVAPLAGSVGGGLAAAGAFSVLTGTPLNVALATSSAYGWYTLAGPVLAAHVGPAFGLLGFLTNFLRENLTMILSPVVGPRVGAEGLSAMGGATAMDSTLYFITSFGEAEAGSLALTSGIVLTLLASLLVPVFAGLPSA